MVRVPGGQLPPRRVVKLFAWVWALCLYWAATAGAAPFVPIGPGDKGTTIQRIQDRLQELGYPIRFGPGQEQRGVFGNQTAAAVRRFQQAYGLRVTGLVDAATWELLMYGQGFWVMGYWFGKGSLSSAQVLQRPPQVLSAIAAMWASIGQDGSLEVEVDEEHVAAAKQLGWRVLLMVHNVEYAQQTARAVAHLVLTDDKVQARLHQQIQEVLDRYGLDGVTIDVEVVPPEDRLAYSRWIGRLAAALHARGRLLVVAVPAMTQAGRSAFDYRELGRLADFVAIMTYDEHWRGGRPGPVASLGWVRRVAEYAVTQIPRQKILLGLGAYGYLWGPSRSASAFPMRNVPDILSRLGLNPSWDPVAQVPFVRYQADGAWYEAWFENEQSLLAKAALVRQLGLGGLALWRLGYETDTFWDLLASRLQLRVAQAAPGAPATATP